MIFKRFQSTITRVIKQHVNCSEEEIVNLQFKSPSLKYKVINSLLQETDKPMTNEQLSNIYSYSDLVKWYQSKETLKGIDLLKTLQIDNLTFK